MITSTGYYREGPRGSDDNDDHEDMTVESVLQVL